MYSQSYPIQRVEGKDTVVVMTLEQALLMNDRFTKLTQDIDSLKHGRWSMMRVADSLATQLYRADIHVHVVDEQMRMQSLLFFLFWSGVVSYLHFF